MSKTLRKKFCPTKWNGVVLHPSLLPPTLSFLIQERALLVHADAFIEVYISMQEWQGEEEHVISTEACSPNDY